MVEIWTCILCGDGYRCVVRVSVLINVPPGVDEHNVYTFLFI